MPKISRITHGTDFDILTFLPIQFQFHIFLIHYIQFIHNTNTIIKLR